jgi:hypothetical protein
MPMPMLVSQAFQAIKSEETLFKLSQRWKVWDLKVFGIQLQKLTKGCHLLTKMYNPSSPNWIENRTWKSLTAISTRLRLNGKAHRHLQESECGWKKDCPVYESANPVSAETVGTWAFAYSNLTFILVQVAPKARATLIPDSHMVL